MKRRRWNLLLGIIAVLMILALIPVFYIESMCRAPMEGYKPTRWYTPVVTRPERRAEARTWLTYPEWHIVYSADSLGRHLAVAPPSSYSYWQDVKGFWTSYCLLNRVTATTGAAGDAKLMIYTIGISFSAEMFVKAFYENTFGRLFEWIGGWKSGDDEYAARVQQQYGEFMHQTPWYRFPFGGALSGLWGTSSKGYFLRHWERRIALSLEYGVKAVYAKVIGFASGATLGRDQLTLRFVARGAPGDARVRAIRGAPGGMTVYEAPRYAAFTDIVEGMAARPVQLVEIAGNDDVFVTFQTRGAYDSAEGILFLSQPLGDRPGWRRIGVSTQAPRLLPLIRAVKASGGELEHVYDY